MRVAVCVSESGWHEEPLDRDQDLASSMGQDLVWLRDQKTDKEQVETGNTDDDGDGMYHRIHLTWET